uniref:Uncharacterized protein n=1 Tax=Avena sativa TaxID=4498 RepID=A0ACD5W5C0_AVESA
MASLDPTANDERARGKRTGAAEHPLPQLPIDLLLEIVQRSDAVTIVRFAATQKLLRGAILAPAFRRLLAVAATNVDPALGFSFREYGVRRAVDTPPLSTGGGGGGQPLVRLDETVTGRYAFKPVAWRDGLLVVRRDSDIPGAIVDELRVCNAFTGDVTASLPPISMPVPSSRDLYRMAWPALYTPALLTAGRSFELLVADGELRTQIFSSDRWEWGAIRDTSFPSHERLPNMDYGAFSCPVVIGRTVYWLCSLPPYWPDDHPDPKILALDVDAAEATVRKIPRYCFSSARCSEHGFNDRVLLASLRGQLCLFVLDRHGISAWTPSDSETTMWSQQVMITLSELEMKAGIGLLPLPLLPQVHLHAFGERSSTMIVEVTPGKLFRFDIREGSKAVRFVKLGSEESKFRHIAYLCLHEMHLVSLLQTMKSFPEGSEESETTAET